MELLDLPPEILSLVCSYLANSIGIKPSIRLRRCSKTLNSHILDAVFALPTFDGLDSADIPDHLRWDLSMNKSLVASLMRAKLGKNQHERVLTRELLRTVDLVETILGHDLRAIYTNALVRLAVEELPLHEIMRGLSRNQELQFTCSDPLENALVAALSLDRQAHVEVLLDQGAEAPYRTKWFGDALIVAARDVQVETFSVLLAKRSATENPRREPFMASRLAFAFERSAAHGRADMFDFNFWSQSWRTCLNFRLMPILEPALESAILAVHDHIVIAIFQLLKANDDHLMASRNGFWHEMLRLAASNGSEVATRRILDRTNLVQSEATVDLPLEDASRNSHKRLVELLLSYRTDRNLTSYRGAMYWGARNARYDILDVLFQSLRPTDPSHFADALCGASIHGSVGFRAVIESAGEHSPLNIPTSLEGKTYAQLIDQMYEREPPARPPIKDFPRFLYIDKSDETPPLHLNLLSQEEFDGTDSSLPPPPASPTPPPPFDLIPLGTQEAMEHTSDAADTQAWFDELKGGEAKRLERACATGHMPAILFSADLVARSEHPWFRGAFITTVEHQLPAVLEYLCESYPKEKFFIDCSVVHVRSIAVLQTLLDHEWIIDAETDRLHPPVLRYVYK